MSRPAVIMKHALNLWKGANLIHFPVLKHVRLISQFLDSDTTKRSYLWAYFTSYKKRRLHN